MQGTQINNGAEVGGVIDLDALLATRLLEPVPVQLGGRTWKVRTDLTGREVMRSLAFIRTADYEGVFTYLLGTRKEISALDTALDERANAEKHAAEALSRGEKTEVNYTPLPYSATATEFFAVLEEMPRMHSAIAQARVFRASKALAEFALDDDTIHRTYDYTPGES